MTIHNVNSAIENLDVINLLFLGWWHTRHIKA
jgi:hypothetical protein